MAENSQTTDPLAKENLPQPSPHTSGVPRADQTFPPTVRDPSLGRATGAEKR